MNNGDILRWSNVLARDVKGGSREFSRPVEGERILANARMAFEMCFWRLFSEGIHSNARIRPRKCWEWVFFLALEIDLKKL